MKRAILIGVGILLIGLVIKMANKPKLEHFKPAEFGVWWLFMNNDLLLLMDAFREALGWRVIISSHKDALGRHGGSDDQSQHNVDMWGDVRAVDVYLMIPNEDGTWRYMKTVEERRIAYEFAKALGFTGIGLYTDTKLGNLMHLDNRESREPGDPAKWSRVGGEYLGIDEVLV